MSRDDMRGAVSRAPLRLARPLLGISKAQLIATLHAAGVASPTIQPIAIPLSPGRGCAR